MSTCSEDNMASALAFIPQVRTTLVVIRTTPTKPLCIPLSLRSRICSDPAAKEARERAGGGTSEASAKITRWSARAQRSVVLLAASCGARCFMWRSLLHVTLTLRSRRST
jgi:hypothetical protein